MQEPTIEEKIDFIYHRLRKEEKVEKRQLLLKWGGRSLLAVFFGYMYFFGINLIVDKTTESVKNVFTQNAGNIKNKVFDVYDSVKGKISNQIKGDSGKTSTAPALDGYTDF